MTETSTASLLDFLSQAVTPFHAVDALSQRLIEAGFQELPENAQWQLEAGGAYYTVRNGSSLIAFTVGSESPPEQGLRMLGAHTDSPCLKVKPEAELRAHGYLQLAVEVYGGVLLNPWFDRDLSLAGRLSVVDTEGCLHSTLVDFEQAIGVIPSLAIHLDREANNQRKINPQTDLPVVIAQLEEGTEFNLRDYLLARLRAAEPDLDCADVLDFELMFYDTQAPAVVGLEGDFIASARLDNLLSCHVTIDALIGSGRAHSSLVVCNDHEEVGSVSAAGAQGTMLRSVLERIIPEVESRARAIDQSMLISVDNAHGIHPNYADRHDGKHGPRLNAGPVIKVNNNQRYASNSETAAVFRYICSREEIPFQTFVVRSDMACGSTIGPLTAAEIGVRTLDIGVPTFAMHSIRELAGSRDIAYLKRALQGFLTEPLQL